MPKRPDEIDPSEDAPVNDGSTAFVRVDRPAPPAPTIVEPPAPRKGLQVSLPDEEPAQPPPPKRAPLAEEDRGRRGAWWNEPRQALPEEPAPPPPEPPPPPPPEPEPLPEPEPPPEPDYQEYRPVAAPDYAGHVPEGPPRWKKLLRRGLLASGALAGLGLLTLVAGYFWISRQIPTFDSVRDYHPLVSTKVIAADGSTTGEFFRERRTVVKMDQVPRVLVQAVLAAEDKDFYKHHGFNPVALARALVVDLASGRKRLGASTITQQVVKNFFLSSKKDWKRKLKEVLLAARLERNLSKDDILFLYLNQINFGKAHYGVEAASLYYFGKHVQEVDLGEAAILAGLPQNPARINPRRHPERAKKRQIYVLDRMLANKFITREEHDAEVAKPILLPPPPPEPPGQWYLEEVRRQLTAQYGAAAVESSGMTVEIAMEPKLQAAAESALQEGLRAVDKRQGFRGAQLKVELDQLERIRAAFARRLLQVQHGSDEAWVLDLEGVHARPAAKKAAPPPKRKAAAEDADEAEPAEDAGGPLTPDALARAGTPRRLEQNGVYAGIVTQVSGAEARVELAPGVASAVPFSTMTWARPFLPERATPAPRSPLDVLQPGDVVPVRATRVSTTRDGPDHVKVTRLELALEQTPLVQGAFVGMDLKTRQVLALVGGYDAARSAFNRATQAKRQPGSSFKPFLYAAALDTGKYTPITRVDDSPEVIVDPWSGKAWKPQNFEKDEFAGPISLRRALAESKNTVAVKLLLDVGLDRVRAAARAAGLASEVPQSYTAALGTGELLVLEEVNGYATLASLGQRSDPVLIKRLLSRDGRVMLSAAPQAEQQLKPEIAYLTADLMRSVIDDPNGTAHSLSALGRPAAGKTGTASEHRDGWFVGFTPSLIAGAWVGFDDHRMMGSYETGGHCAGPIWLSWMRSATANTPREDWPLPPPGVTVVKVNRNTGALTNDNDPYGVREVFLAGTEPTQSAEEQQPSQEEFYQAPH